MHMSYAHAWHVNIQAHIHAVQVLLMLSLVLEVLDFFGDAYVVTDVPLTVDQL